MDIKYRVWCKNKKEWETDKCFVSQSGDLYSFLRNDITPLRQDTHIVQQCTGFRDMSGKLIYEGDVIETKEGWVKQIIYTDGRYRLGDTLVILCAMEIECFQMEVVGNIFENPELFDYIGSVLDRVEGGAWK